MKAGRWFSFKPRHQVRRLAFHKDGPIITVLYSCTDNW